MKFTIPMSAMGATKATWMILFHFASDRLDPILETMDESFAEHEEVDVGPLGRVWENGGLTGQYCEVTVFKNFPHIVAKHLLVVGLGDEDKLSARRLAESLERCISEIAPATSQTLAMSLPYQCLQGIDQSYLAESVTRTCIESFTQHQEYKPFRSVLIGGLQITKENGQAIQRAHAQA